MPWYAQYADLPDTHKLWADPDSELEEAYLDMGFFEVPAPAGWTPGPDPDPATFLVRSINGTQPDENGALTLAPASIGALDQAAGDARYAHGGLAAGAQTAVLFGDSIVAQCQDEIASRAQGFYDAYSWTNWAAMHLGYRLVVVRNAGIGGNKTGDMLARIDTDVQPYASDWVIMDGGVNDLFDGTGTALATTIANLTAIFQKVTQVYGRKVMMMLPTGSGYGTATTLANLYTLHRWLKKYAREHRGIYLFDGHGWYSDPADGMPIAGYVRPGDAAPDNNNRGVHPGFLGAAKIGRALADALDPHVGKVGGSYASTNADTLNLMANGRMTGDQGTGLATSWTLLDNAGVAAQGATTTKVNRADGKPGQVQQVVWDGTGTACRLFGQNTDTTKFAAGDLVFAEVEFETDPDTVGNYQLALELTFWNGLGGANSLKKRSQDDPVVAGVDVWPRKGIIRTPAKALPAGTGRLQLSVYCPKGTTRILSVAVRKVDY